MAAHRRVGLQGAVCGRPRCMTAVAPRQTGTRTAGTDAGARSTRSGWKADSHSAAVAIAVTAVTRAAQNLNSGILPKGSSAGLVSRLAAASA